VPGLSARPGELSL